MSFLEMVQLFSTIRLVFAQKADLGVPDFWKDKNSLCEHIFLHFFQKIETVRQKKNCLTYQQPKVFHSTPRRIFKVTPQVLFQCQHGILKYGHIDFKFHVKLQTQN